MPHSIKQLNQPCTSDQVELLESYSRNRTNKPNSNKVFVFIKTYREMGNYGWRSIMKMSIKTGTCKTLLGNLIDRRNSDKMKWLAKVPQCISCLNNFICIQPFTRLPKQCSKTCLLHVTQFSVHHQTTGFVSIFI